MVDDHLSSPPTGDTGGVIVCGNEILVGERHLVFRLAGATQA